MHLQTSQAKPYDSHPPSLNLKEYKLLQNRNIDQNNLSIITSDEYLRNYTYLEFSLFPELFPLYLNQLSPRQLQYQLESYVGTLMQFFTESLVYETYYEPSLWGRPLLESLSNTISQQKLLLQFDGQNDAPINTRLINLTLEVNNLTKKVQKGITKPEILTQLVREVDFLQSKNQLSQIVRDLRKNPLTSQLFDLICELIKFMVSHNYMTSLTKFQKPLYLMHAAVWAITKEYAETIQKNQGENQLLDNTRLQIELLQIKLLPFQIELNEFYRNVKIGKTRQYYLGGLAHSGLYKMESYLRLIRLVASIDEFIRAYKERFQRQQPQHFNVSDPVLKTTKAIVELIEQCVSRSMLNKDRNSTSQGQVMESKKVQTTKELSYQNVQKIAKLISRLELNQDHAQQKKEQMDIEKGHQLIRNKPNQLRRKRLEVDMRKIISSQFLMKYYKLQEVLQDSHCHSTINKENSRVSNITRLLEEMFGMSNEQLTELFAFQDKSLSNIISKLEQLDAECNLTIETIAKCEQNIQQRQLTKQSQAFGVQKISKIKNSLFTNILTIKILKSTFTQHNTISPTKQHLELIYDQETNIRTLSDIKLLFDQIIQYSIESRLSYSSKQSSKTQMTTYPALKCILLLFGSIQLWYEFSQKTKKNKKQIEQFYQAVIKRYSSQNVKIAIEEVVYVELILTHFGLFQQVNRDTDFIKVNEKISKLLQLKQKYLNIDNLINSQQCLEKVLQILSLKLIASCFPSQQCHKNNGTAKPSLSINEQNAVNDSFNQNLYKLPFWKLISIHYTNPLTAHTFIDLIDQNIIEQQRETFINQKKQGLNSNVVNVDQPVKKDPAVGIIKTENRQSITQLLEIFITFKDKYLQLMKHKQDIRNEQSSESVKRNQSNQNILQTNRQQCLQFWFQLTHIMCQSFVTLQQLNSQFSSFSDTNGQISQVLCSQVRSFVQKINSQTNKLINSLQQSVINPKVQTFKPSQLQINQILQHSGLQTTELNKQLLLEKIKHLQSYYDNLLQFSLFGLAFLAWIKMEASVKVEILSSNSESMNIHKLQDKSTFFLLRMITLFSLCTNNQLQVNFQQLQLLLESNIDIISKTKPSQFLLESFQFPKLQVNSQSVHTQIQNIGSYQFLQFLYEYIPFDISSQEEQIKLFNLTMDYALRQDNHQFLNSQKTQKILFNRICHYLESIQNSRNQNSQKDISI